jgi:hypothetical protein
MFNHNGALFFFTAWLVIAAENRFVVSNANSAAHIFAAFIHFSASSVNHASIQPEQSSGESDERKQLQATAHDAASYY